MKLLNLNIGIKLDNTEKVISFIKTQNLDFIVLQEVAYHHQDTALKIYQSRYFIEKATEEKFPYTFFAPLHIADKVIKNGEISREFGAQIEQGNEILSPYPILESSNKFYYKEYSEWIDRTNFKKEDHPRALQKAKFCINGKDLQIFNVHGIWTEDKLGDQRTIKQCEFILQEAKNADIPTIICGDFNLLPHSESIQILNREFRNIISEYNIQSTRPNFTDDLESGNTLVDYIFVNDKIQVNNFEVFPTEISDHFPLILDFEIK